MVVNSTEKSSNRQLFYFFETVDLDFELADL